MIVSSDTAREIGQRLTRITDDNGVTQEQPFVILAPATEQEYLDYHAYLPYVAENMDIWKSWGKMKYFYRVSTD